MAFFHPGRAESSAGDVEPRDPAWVEGQQIAGGDQATERVRIDDNGPVVRRRPDLGKPFGEVVVVEAPALHVAAASARAAHAPMVIRRDVESRGGELVANVLVPTGVLAEAVNQQDECPR